MEGPEGWHVDDVVGELGWPGTLERGVVRFTSSCLGVWGVGFGG